MVLCDYKRAVIVSFLFQVSLPARDKDMYIFSELTVLNLCLLFFVLHDLMKVIVQGRSIRVPPPPKQKNIGANILKEILIKWKLVLELPRIFWEHVKN